MKKLKVLATILCIATLGLFTSCSKDNAELIIGTWEVESVTLNGVEVTAGMPIGMTWTFNENNTMVLKYAGETLTENYLILEEDIEEAGHVLYEKGTLVIGEVGFKIEELNKKELKLKDIDRELVDGGTINFKKV